MLLVQKSSRELFIGHVLRMRVKQKFKNGGLKKSAKISQEKNYPV